MTDSIAEILGRQRFEEPEEVLVIKSFVKEHFDHIPGVAIQSSQIIISVPNAALAGTLRMHLHELASLCQTKKRLVIRIS
jgi:hypothetical protein